MTETRDETVPTGRWTFDDEVTEAFDDMLERSIPAYTEMRRLVTELAVDRYDHENDVIDLGCSRGEALARILAELPHARSRFIGVEISEPMAEAARDRFSADDRVRILRSDLRKGLGNMLRPCVTLAVLTLQFVPIEHRQRLVQTVYDQTTDGGAFVVVEKILGATAELDDLFVRRYLEMKRQHGYTEEQIDRKRLALEGVLVPVTADWNRDLLARAGWSVDGFWRHLNFAGWIGVK